jgi:hypothetical protein
MRLRIPREFSSLWVTHVRAIARAAERNGGSLPKLHQQVTSAPLSMLEIIEAPSLALAHRKLSTKKQK